MYSIDRIVSTMDVSGVETVQVAVADSLPWVMDYVPDLEDALRQSSPDASSIDLNDYVSTLNGITLSEIQEYIKGLDGADIAAMADPEIQESDSATLIGRTLRNYVNVLAPSAGPVLINDLLQQVQAAAKEGDVSAASDSESLAADVSFSPAAAAALLDPRTKAVDEAAKAAQLELVAIPEETRQKVGATLRNDVSAETIIASIGQANPEEMLENIREVISNSAPVFGIEAGRMESLLQSITASDIEEISGHISVPEIDNVLQFFTSKF
eukprot:GHVT01096356.1.p1 GENE.GHVT01096356.1~~GHVT01096356.1.p1  ORF type:complete len:269 (+),score=45.62 GHVT01096356.1:1356-2162(+)